MPFGLPYDNEEQRRRLMMTPGINPNAPNMPMPTRSAPTLTASDPLPPPRPNIPMPAPTIREAPLPEYRPPMITRAEGLAGAKDEFMAKTPGRFKSGVMGALRGLGQGLATGGGLGAGLGGAIAGGAGGAINPRGMREMEFNQVKKPQIFERFRLEDQEAAQRTAVAKAAADQAMTQAQLENIGGQMRSREQGDRLAREKEEREANAPLVLNPGQVAVDRRTQKEVFKVPATPREPRAPTEAELSIEPSSGKSFEEIAEESYQNRGGDAEVFSKLPARTQQLINGQIKDAAPAEVQAAQRAFQDAITRQRKTDLDYTRGSVRGRALGAKKSEGAKSGPIVSSKGQPGRRAISVAEAAELLK